MKRNTRTLLVAVLGALAAIEPAFAADPIDFGKREFLNKCAACHGASARGDGAVAGSLRVPPTDLTTLSKRNGGVFPSDRVYRVIDGRERVPAHGTRDMPVWGNVLTAEGGSATKSNSDAPVDMDVEVRTRIVSLVDYLNRIQTE
jgi:mono/diheme cytochrome c family protein